MTEPALPARLTRLFITAALLAVAAGFWFLQIYGAARPEAAPLNAPARAFSAARAEQVLARILGPEKPHPVSTKENARVRARIASELVTLGLHPFVFHGFACHSPHKSGVLICASVNDVIAQVLPGAGRAIVLLAHHDSVPAGPGSADDESGVATVIETARALMTSGRTNRHPVLAVLTDGEEADLLGAAAFLRDASLKARVGAVINVEARGNQGPSLLFQTSPADAQLIDLYAHNTPNYATSSLYHEIYRFLPNDTDLTLFIADGFPSFNFAFVGGVADYHTALDTRANLDPVSLQEQGDNMLGVARGLDQADFARLRDGNDIYFDVLGRWLPRVPADWALPLAIFAFLLVVAALLVSRGTRITAPQWLRAFAITPALILIAAGSGFLLHGIAQVVSGMPDPSYAHPMPLRLALAFELGGAAVLVSRLAPARASEAGVWLWLSGLGIFAAVLVPGVSPYFIVPALAAGIVLLPAASTPRSWDGKFGTFAVFVAALAALLVWSAIGTSGEMIAGLSLHPMLTVPFAIGMSTLVPLLARYRMAGRWWRTTTATLFVAACGAAVVQGLLPSYSTAAAQRLNVTYVEGRNRALWAANATAPLPRSMRSAAAFSVKTERPSEELPLSYIAPAPDQRFPLPNATIIARPPANGVRRITLMFHGSGSTNQMYLAIPKSAKVKSIDIDGWHFDAPPDWAKEDSVALACMSRDCATQTVTLTLATSSGVTLSLYEHRFGLPEFAHRLIAARPDWAVQSQNGDGITLISDIHIPAAQ